MAHFITTPLNSSWVLNSFSRCSTLFWIPPQWIDCSAVIFHESGNSSSLSSSLRILYLSSQRSIAAEISCSCLHLAGFMIPARRTLLPCAVVRVNQRWILKYGHSPSPCWHPSIFSSASPSALALRMDHRSRLSSSKTISVSCSFPPYLLFTIATIAPFLVNIPAVACISWISSIFSYSLGAPEIFL